MIDDHHVDLRLSAFQPQAQLLLHGPVNILEGILITWRWWVIATAATEQRLIGPVYQPEVVSASESCLVDHRPVEYALLQKTMVYPESSLFS